MMYYFCGHALLVYLLVSVCHADIITYLILPNSSRVTSHAIESYYSTLGNRVEESNFFASPTFISEANVTNDCVFKGIDSDQITDRVLVFVGHLPSFYGCNRHLGGPAVALARMAQASGAVAVVIHRTEEFLHGRMTGITADITIPFVVVPPSSMNFLCKNASSIIELQFQNISSHEKQVIHQITRSYFALRYTAAGLYFVATILLSYILYTDILRIYHNRKKLAHSIVMKAFAVAACLAAFIWLIVDPFYYQALSGWYPYMCMKVHTGFFTIDFIFILRLCAKAASKATNTLVPFKILVLFIYPLIGLMLFVMFFSGIMWYYPSAIYAFYYSQIGVFGFCAIGFALYGRDIWKILTRSGNVTPNRSCLPLRIMVFISFYVIEAYTGNMLNQAGALGLVFGLLFNFFMNGFGFIAIFLILFFQPKQPKKTCSPPATSSRASRANTLINSELPEIKLDTL